MASIYRSTMSYVAVTLTECIPTMKHAYIRITLLLPSSTMFEDLKSVFALLAFALNKFVALSKINDAPKVCTIHISFGTIHNRTTLTDRTPRNPFVILQGIFTFIHTHTHCTSTLKRRNGICIHASK